VSDDELMRGAIREANDDLDALVTAAVAAAEVEPDPERRAADLTTALLSSTPWDRVMLASVLGVALVRLSATTGGEAARVAPPNDLSEVANRPSDIPDLIPGGPDVG
jgi:hypothetical protein